MTTSNLPVNTATTPAPGHYHVDEGRTTIRLAGRHLFGLGAVSGTVRLRRAELVVGEPATTTTLHATLDAASFDTGNRARDAAVRSPKYLDTAAHPDITFVAEDVHRLESKWVASGTLTARGVDAPLDVTLHDFDERSDELTLHASARIDRYAHDITAGKGLAGRWLTIDIIAIATR